MDGFLVRAPERGLVSQTFPMAFEGGRRVSERDHLFIESGRMAFAPDHRVSERGHAFFARGRVAAEPDREVIERGRKVIERVHVAIERCHVVIDWRRMDTERPRMELEGHNMELEWPRVELERHRVAIERHCMATERDSAGWNTRIPDTLRSLELGECSTSDTSKERSCEWFFAKCVVAQGNVARSESSPPPKRLVQRAMVLRRGPPLFGRRSQLDAADVAVDLQIKGLALACIGGDIAGRIHRDALAEHDAIAALLDSLELKPTLRIGKSRAALALRISRGAPCHNDFPGERLPVRPEHAPTDDKAAPKREGKRELLARGDLDAGFRLDNVARMPDAHGLWACSHTVEHVRAIVLCGRGLFGEPISDE